MGPCVWLIFPLPIIDLTMSFRGISAGLRKDRTWRERRIELCTVSWRKAWASGHTVYCSELLDLG